MNYSYLYMLVNLLKTMFYPRYMLLCSFLYIGIQRHILCWQYILF